MGPTRADIYPGISQSRASLKALGEELSANSFERIEMSEHPLLATQGRVVLVPENDADGVAMGGVRRFCPLRPAWTPRIPICGARKSESRHLGKSFNDAHVGVSDHIFDFVVGDTGVKKDGVPVCLVQVVTRNDRLELFPQLNSERRLTFQRNARRRLIGCHDGKDLSVDFIDLDARPEWLFFGDLWKFQKERRDVVQCHGTTRTSSRAGARYPSDSSFTGLLPREWSRETERSSRQSKVTAGPGGESRCEHSTHSLTALMGVVVASPQRLAVTVAIYVPWYSSSLTRPPVMVTR